MTVSGLGVKATRVLSGVDGELSAGANKLPLHHLVRKTITVPFQQEPRVGLNVNVVLGDRKCAVLDCVWEVIVVRVGSGNLDFLLTEADVTYLYEVWLW